MFFSREFDYKVGWVPKNWCFWTVGLRRLLRVPWTGRRSNPSVLKEINPEYSVEGLMLKLKLQYFGHLMWRTDSLEKTLMQEKTEGRRRRGRQGRRWLDDITTQWTWVWANSMQQWRLIEPGTCSPWSCKEVDTTEQQNNNPPYKYTWVCTPKDIKAAQILISTVKKWIANQQQKRAWKTTALLMKQNYTALIMKKKM